MGQCRPVSRVRGLSVLGLQPSGGSPVGAITRRAPTIVCFRLPCHSRFALGMAIRVRVTFVPDLNQDEYETDIFSHSWVI
jgi:hypothetical protein